MADLRRAPRSWPLPPSLHLPLDGGGDYVAGFQDLARLGMEMHGSGPTLPLLLRKAVLELRVGSYAGACLAACDALACRADCAEAHWLHALSLLGLCLVDLGLLTEGPGEALPERVPAPARLAAARLSLLECVRLGRGEDQESAALLAFVESVLAARPSRGRLAELLAGLV